MRVVAANLSAWAHQTHPMHPPGNLRMQKRVRPQVEAANADAADVDGAGAAAVLVPTQG